MKEFQHESYTESKLNQIIYKDIAKSNTRFLIVVRSLGGYIYTKFFKKKEITINKDYITIKTKYSYAPININDIILIEQLNLISGF